MLSARIGLVVADGDLAGLLQRRDQWLRDAAVSVPQDADLPRTLDAIENGREAVDGDDRGRETPIETAFDQLIDGLVIGPETDLGPGGDVGGAEARVAGNVDPIAEREDRGRVIERAVAIDHKPGIGREYGRCIEARRQTPSAAGIARPA